MATLNFINKNEWIYGVLMDGTDRSVSRGSAYYALYYGFTIPAGGATLLTFDESSSVDTYMYLRRGQEPYGIGFGSTVITYNDDGGVGYDSRIYLASLEAGEYTLDLTTYSSGRTATIDVGAFWTDNILPSTDRSIYIPSIKGISGSSLVTYYKMRGYYVAGGVYETYTTIGAPSETPPSGHTLTNVAIVSTWRQ